MKYEKRKKSIAFSKALAKKKLKKKHELPLSKITKLELDIGSEGKFDEYDKTKNEIKKKIRQHSRRCENLQLMFLVSSLEKRNAMCGTIKTLLDDRKEVTTPSKISLTLKFFYENLFQKNIAKSICDL